MAGLVEEIQEAEKVQTNANLKQWQELKLSFHQRLYNREDTADLFLLLPSVKSTQNAEEVVSFFRFLAKQYNIGLAQIPCDSNPSARDSVLFRYLEAEAASGDDLLEIYEEFNRRMPSSQYVKAIINQIYYKNLVGAATSEDEEKFSNYIDQFNSFETKSSADIVQIKFTEANFWELSKKYEVAEALYKELVSSSNVDYKYRSESLSSLMCVYIVLERFEEAKQTFFAYQSVPWVSGFKDVLFDDLRNAYGKKADVYKKEKRYLRAIEWYLKVAALEKRVGVDSGEVYANLYDAYFELVKKYPKDGQYLDQILDIPCIPINS